MYLVSALSTNNGCLFKIRQEGDTKLYSCIYVLAADAQ